MAEFTKLGWLVVLVDGAPSTMTYLPTKFTIILGRDDDVRHAGLWYMHLVRFGHGKFLIVSAADLQKHDRDTHAAVYISQTSHHAHDCCSTRETSLATCGQTWAT